MNEMNAGGVTATLGLDADGFKKGIEEAKTGMKQATDEAKKFSQDFRQVSKSLREAGLDAKEIRKIKTELMSTRPDLVAKQLSTVESQLHAIGASSADVEKVKSRMQEVQKAASGVADDMKGVNDQVRGIGSGSGLSTISSQLENIDSNGKRVNDRIDALSALLAGLGAGQALRGLINTMVTLTEEASQLTNAYKGLTEVSKAVGQNTQEVQKAVDDLVKKGFMNATEAATAYKTALAAGYDLEQSTKLINALGDAAAYNREAHLGWGEAVVQAIRGIKQQESELTDAAGITTNLSVMYDRYAASVGKSAAKLTDAEKMQAAYNGMMQEAALFAGNAGTAMEGYAGTQAYFSQTVATARQELGEAFLPVIERAMEVLGPMIVKITEWVSENKEVVVGIASAGAAVLSLITVVGSLIGVVAALTVAFGALNIAMGPIGWIITGIALLAVGIGTYTLAAGAASKETLQLADSQQKLNEKLNESPVDRNVEDLKKLQADTKTLNDLLERRRILEAELQEITNQQKNYDYSNLDKLPEINDELYEINKKLKDMDFQTPEQAAQALARMKEEAKKSVPALLEMQKAELQDVAAKNNKILSMERAVQEYNKLNSIERLNEEQKKKLVDITNTLKAQYPDLHALMDQEGRIRIDNIGTIRQQISVEKSLVSASVSSARTQITNLQKVAQSQRASVEAQIRNYQQLLKTMAAVSGAKSKVDLGPQMGVARTIFESNVKKGLKTGLDTAYKEQNKYAAAELEAKRALASLDKGKLDDFAYKAPSYPTSSGDSKKGKKGKEKSSSGKSAAEIAKDQRKEAFDAAMASAQYVADYYDQTADQQIIAYKKIQVAHKRHLKESIEDERQLNLQIKRLNEDSAKSRYDFSVEWIDRQDRRMEESGKSEVEIAQMKLSAWTRLRDRYKKDSEFYKQADDKVYESRKSLIQAQQAAAKAQYDASADWTDQEGRRMEESGKTELQIAQMKLEAWTRIRNRYEKDSELYKKADEQVYQARKDLISKMKTENTTFLKAQKESVEKAKQTELDAIEERKKAYIDAQDAKIAAIDALIKKEEQQNSEDDYHAQLAKKQARVDLLSTAVSPEGRKERADLIEEIEQMQLEHSREIRKRDLEDQKQALENEKDERGKAFDKEKEDAEKRYDALSKAFEDYQDDVNMIESSIRDFRIGANAEANAQILRDLDNFVSQYNTKLSSIASIDSGMSQEALDLQEYNTNKDAFNAAKSAGNKSEMARLNQRNQELRNQYGVKKDTGKLPSFDVGGRVPGPVGAPMQAIIHGGEAIFNPNQLDNLFRLLEVPRALPAYDRGQASPQQVINHFDMSVGNVEVTDGADAEILYTQRERTARRLATSGGGK